MLKACSVKGDFGRGLEDLSRNKGKKDGRILNTESKSGPIGMRSYQKYTSHWAGPVFFTLVLA